MAQWLSVTAIRGSVTTIGHERLGDGEVVLVNGDFPRIPGLGDAGWLGARNWGDLKQLELPDLLLDSKNCVVIRSPGVVGIQGDLGTL